MDFDLKVSDQRLLASGLGIIAIAGVSVSGILNFPQASNLGLYATFALFALLIIIWRRGLGLTADDLQLPFTDARHANPHRLRWWQAVLVIIGMLAYGILSVVILKGLQIPVMANQVVANNTHSHVIMPLFAMLPQVGIEEMVTLSLLLIIASLSKRWWHLHRRNALGIGLVISTIIFVLLHFQAYQWHLAQMFIVIGGSRVILSGLFLNSHSVSDVFVCHYIYDALLLTITLLVP
ncbi:hypothetical protein [Lacticaseibacillus porcinae]|uniref:hypothetical protein n=1 Tax=Lacticaseibacillus porcinae TaxID=1123687 RepID=UPI000F799893|nr:hypothetical protein [Lacticaseibacillus porcinae]